MIIKMTTTKKTGMQTKNGAKERGRMAPPATAERKNPTKMRIRTTPNAMGMSCGGLGPRRGAAGYQDSVRAAAGPRAGMDGGLR